MYNYELFHVITSFRLLLPLYIINREKSCLLFDVSILFSKSGPIYIYKKILQIHFSGFFLRMTWISSCDQWINTSSSSWSLMISWIPVVSFFYPLLSPLLLRCPSHCHSSHAFKQRDVGVCTPEGSAQHGNKCAKYESAYLRVCFRIVLFVI